MTLRLQICHLFVGLSIISIYGCAALQGISAKQERSENYALTEGVQTNHPVIIDGNIGTVGQSQYVESSSNIMSGAGTPSECVVLLPEPKSIHRVVIHSPNLVTFSLWAMDQQRRWEKIKEIKSNKKKVIDVRLNRAVYTTGIKIRVLRTSDDTVLRRQNVVNLGGGWRSWRGKVRAPAKIGEIELYGFIPKGDNVDVPSQEELDDKEVEELLKF